MDKISELIKNKKCIFKDRWDKYCECQSLDGNFVCEKHSKLKCHCEKQAVRQCGHSDVHSSWLCDHPLCENCLDVGDECPGCKTPDNNETKIKLEYENGHSQERFYSCLSCNHVYIKEKYNYCPNCGRKITGIEK